MSLALFYIWFTAEVIAIVISLFGNGIVIYVMCADKALCKKSNLFVISIAVADFICTVFVILLTTFRTIQQLNSAESHPKRCLWFAACFLVLTAVSILQFVFVSIDRYWAICHPYSYRQRNIKFPKFVIIFCWVAGTIIGLIPLMNGWTKNDCSLHKHHYILLSGLGGSSSLIIMVLYSFIYKAFLRQVS